MDALSFAVLRRCLACIALPQPSSLLGDAGRDLDAILERILDACRDLPGLTQAAVVMIDDEDQPAIRASLGTPDVGLILAGALDRGGDVERPRVLRRGASPALADADAAVDLPRHDAAMLAAPVAVDGSVVGWFFANALLGPDAPLSEDLRLAACIADSIGRVAAVAGQYVGMRRETAQELAFLRSKVSLRYRHVFSMGPSPALASLRGEADRAALSDDPVALLGEPGCGRNVLARVIHEISPRAVRPFYSADAGASDLAERLFGVSRSQAPGSGPGLLEEADGGALLVTEAHRLSPDVAARLARYLKTGTFTRINATRQRQADTRLLFSAGPQGLAPDLTAARRLLPLRVPSLRQRRDDIPELLDHFLSVVEQRSGRRLTFTPKALKALEAYDWPGNIREMETMVARLAVTTVEDRIDIADIPPEILAEGERPPVLPEDAAELRDMERQQVLNALERHGWVQSRAARELGLTLRQIGYRIRKYGLSRDEDDA